MSAWGGGGVRVRAWARGDAEEAARLVEIWRGAVEATHGFLGADDVDSLEGTVAEYLPRMAEVLVAEIVPDSGDGPGVEAGGETEAGGEIDADAEIVDGDARGARDARDARGVVGFLAHDGGQIDMLFVDPSAHGRGVGTRLLDDVAARFDVLTVDVNEQNPSGRRFYRARGFEQVGRSELDGQGRPFPLLHLRRTR